MTDTNPATPTGTPRGSPWLWACRVAILLALGASAALFVQYLNPAAASFCGLDSGCEVVRRFGYRAVAGLAESSALVRAVVETPLLSTPLVGLLGFGTVLFVSLAHPRGRWTLRLSGVGAIVALVLIFVQVFVVHAFCWLCLVVDGSAVATFLFASLDSRAAGPGVDPLRRGAWIGLAAAMLVIPFGWTKVKPLPKVPDVITALYEPGKINVVEFADFECPFCRMFHPVLQKVMKDFPGRVHFVRRHVPLPGHPDAGPAALAAVCAELQGKGEDFAARLMVIELSEDTVRRAAKEAGLDLVEWDRCQHSPVPGQRVLADIKLIEAAGMLGLPTTYVGDVRLLGAVPEPELREAFAIAASGRRPFSVPAPVYVGLSLALLAAVAWLGRTRRGTVEHERTG